ncbi:MAG: hypothetical protein HY708_05880 [Ignavibacteriae bacterium]|nr:hypothetical protein [Ignavibacteriota bacterium]
MYSLRGLIVPVHNLSPRMMRIFTRAAAVSLSLCAMYVSLFFSDPAPLFAQVSTRISSVVPNEAVSRTPLTIKATLVQGEAAERVHLVYRSFGQSDWTRLEMDVAGNVAAVVLPAREVLQPFLEYYIVLTLRSGVMESYPLSESPDPFAVPPGRTMHITVREEEEAQIVFLSPEPNAITRAEDALISVSLLRADSLVVRRASQLYVDGINVTGRTVFSDDILVFSPDVHKFPLPPGRHKVTVLLFNRLGLLHRTANLYFTVTGEAQQNLQRPAEFKYNVSVNAESRREKIRNAKTWYNRGTFQFGGRTGDWQLKSNVYITSDEKPDRQPQNRYFIGIESPFVRIGYGDSYPTFPNLILNGKRVRGLNSSVTVSSFNIDLVLGRTVRAVDGSLLKIIPLASLATEQQRDPNAAYAPVDANTWGKFAYGTYERRLFAVRPSFGSPERLQVGFTWLKSKDDVASIRHGIRPQENLVIGVDFISRLDENRIELSGQGAFSAFNADISSGTFTDAYIDSVYKQDAGKVKQVRDLLDNLITVNDNLRPLSFKNLSTFAYEAALGLNYFDNSLKFTYLFRGSDYNSFGQTFIRKDIRGFNIVDRIRLFQSQIFVTLGYEALKDNTGKTKVATTTFTNLNVAVSYYSRTNLPHVTVGYSRFSNYNRLLSASAIDDQTNRVYLQSSYSYDLLAKHTTSLSVSTSIRNDYTATNMNVRNVALTVGNTTRYIIPFQTTIEYSLNLNKLPSAIAPGTTQKLNYSIVTLNGRYSFSRDVVSIFATVSPTFGDFARTVLDAGTQWQVLPSMSVSLQYSYFHNRGNPHDDFWSLRYRYEL